MKRFVSILLVIVSLFAIALPAFAAQVSKPEGVNVRKRPSTSYQSIGKVYPGTTLTVRFNVIGAAYGNHGKNWSYITWYQNDTYKGGYIHSYFLDSTTPSSVRPASSILAFGGDTLKYGSTGIGVYNMQLILYNHGYLNSINDCDGIYGSKTLTALKAFQNFYGLTDDGLAGTQTKAKLWAYRSYRKTATGHDTYNICPL